MNWRQEEMQKQNRKTNLLTIHGQHHPKADVDHLYVPRKQGGRGQMRLEEAYSVEITKLVEYIYTARKIHLDRFFERTNTASTEQCYS